MTENACTALMKRPRRDRKTRAIAVPLGRIIGERLKAAREATGLTQVALGGKLGALPQVVSMMEHGRSIPALWNIILWARACGQDPRVLLSEIVDEVDAAEKAAREDQGR